MPAAVAFVAYLPALFGSWVWDDHLVVGRQLRAFRSLADVFFPPSGIPNFSAHYYRPLTTASYLIDRFLYGERPLGFHFTLLAAHALAASLVFLLIRSMMGSSREAQWAALGTSLLFAVHPVHVESVGWITARADVMAGVCLLGTALLLRRRPLGTGEIVGASVLFAMGCLFKEVAFAFLPLVPLFAGRVEGERARIQRPAEDTRSRRHKEERSRVDEPPGSPRKGAVREADRSGRRWAALVAVAVSAGFMLLLRRAALGNLGGDAPRGDGPPWLEALGGAMAFYLTRSVIPLAPQPYGAVLPHGVIAWVGLGAAGLLAAAALALLRRPPGRIAGLGLASFLVLIIPSLAPALLRISSVPLAERYLYVPTAFGSLALASALAALLKSSRKRLIAGSLLTGLVLLGAITALRTRIWRDEVSLWTAASASGTAAFPRISLATALEERGEHGRAEEIYRGLLRDSTSLDPAQIALVHMNLGVVLRATSRLPDARRELEDAVRLDPSQSLAWFNLASVLWELSVLDPRTGTADRAMIERADASASRAVRLSPFDPNAQLLKGRIAGSLGRREEARSALERTAELDPQGEAGETARQLLGLMR